MSECVSKWASKWMCKKEIKRPCQLFEWAGCFAIGYVVLLQYVWSAWENVKILQYKGSERSGVRHVPRRAVAASISNIE